ncbi:MULTISPECIES: hypothetical protein [unclassified Mesorhizobium]|uniref:hypothetical protein n=1 Tax=unclassified Mesorhizobium TaxID=325217 RepID=UPI001FE1CBDD|nr:MULTISPECIES: hypothetical protein [unclassified Mesorhizobium]
MLAFGTVRIWPRHPKGIAHIKRIESLLEEPNSDLPALVREKCFDLLEQIAEKTARIEVKMAKAKALFPGD